MNIAVNRMNADTMTIEQRCALPHRRAVAQSGRSVVSAAQAFATTLMLLAILPQHPVAADVPSADKSKYNLFNRTPRELLRPMALDRPDITESPRTVDAGWVQVELSFFEYERDGDRSSYTYAPTNVKLGLLNNTDLQFIFTPYSDAEVDDSTNNNIDTRRATGFGDIEVRLKVNLWGNDEGNTAFGVMPFLRLPTASRDLGSNHVEGGIILPFAIDLNEQWDLGFMAEFDFIYDEIDGGYDTELLHTAVIGGQLMDSLGVYLEYAGILSTDGDENYRALLGTGLTYVVSSDLVLDAGLNFGLTGDVPDINPFVGMSVRF